MFPYLESLEVGFLKADSVLEPRKSPLSGSAYSDFSAVANWQFEILLSVETFSALVEDALFI